MSTEKNFPVQSRAEIDIIGDNTNKAIQRTQSFTSKFIPQLTKNSTKLDAMCNELIIEPTEQINKSLDSAEIVELSESKSNESGEQQEENCGEPELSVKKFF